jgi:uncharacterized protein (DUF1697 family)
MTRSGVSTHIALLRGVNVGGKHKLSMKDLVCLMTAAGFTEVRTYIQSGNVVFRSSAAKAKTLGKLIEQEFGFAPDVFLLTAAELRVAVDRSPYTPKEGKHAHLFFCDREPKSVDSVLLDALKSATEEYRLIGRIIYLHAPDGIGSSKLVEKLGKGVPGVRMTARNLNTLNKLVEMSADST